jgi:hypothetical protein
MSAPGQVKLPKLQRIAALNDGARYIIIDRPSDSALFASDMIRRGIDTDLAYHVGRVLKFGARARDPASHFESLVAEIYDDRSTLFVSPATKTRCAKRAKRPRSATPGTGIGGTRRRRPQGRKRHAAQAKKAERG